MIETIAIVAKAETATRTEAGRPILAVGSMHNIGYALVEAVGNRCFAVTLDGTYLLCYRDDLTGKLVGHPDACRAIEHAEAREWQAIRCGCRG